LEEALRVEQRIRKESDGRHDNILRLDGDGLMVTHSFYGRPLNAMMTLKDEIPGIQLTFSDHKALQPEMVFVRYELPPVKALEEEFKRFKQIDAASFLRLINYARAMHERGPERDREKLEALKLASKELFKPAQSSSE